MGEVFNSRRRVFFLGGLSGINSHHWHLVTTVPNLSLSPDMPRQSDDSVQRSKGTLACHDGQRWAVAEVWLHNRGVRCSVGAERSQLHKLHPLSHRLVPFFSPHSKHIRTHAHIRCHFVPSAHLAAPSITIAPRSWARLPVGTTAKTRPDRSQIAASGRAIFSSQPAWLSFSRPRARSSS